MDLHNFIQERHLTNVSPVAPLSLSLQMASGVNHLHSLQLLHRDLKPANVIIFLQEELQIVCKIADFGLAREIPESTTAFLTPAVVTQQTFQFIFIWLPPSMVYFLFFLAHAALDYLVYISRLFL